MFVAGMIMGMAASGLMSLLLRNAEFCSEDGQ